jgi:hypothetical protein
MGRLGQRRDSERDSERLARNKGLEGAGTVDAIVTLPPTCVYGVRGRQRNETSTRTHAHLREENASSAPSRESRRTLLSGHTAGERARRPSLW